MSKLLKLLLEILVIHIEYYREINKYATSPSNKSIA